MMGVQDQWKEVIQKLEQKIRPEHLFWVQAIQCQIKDNQIFLEVPSHQYKNWIQTYFWTDICTAIDEVWGHPCKVSLKIKTSSKILGIQEKEERARTLVQTGLFRIAETPPKPKKNRKIRERWTAQKANLNPSYTFKAFIVGPSNQMAHAASLAVAKHLAEEYNPLFIYGGVGLGKTHLMQAVGHEVIRRSAGKLKVIYRTSEAFMNELISSIEHKSMDRFREFYRTQCDLLLIDDIQLLSGKERTQEEFFHTFNALYNSRRQIILTSDKTPQQIPKLEERLRSRFNWGLLADIQKPEVETRIAILRRKMARESLVLSTEILEYLAHKIDTNVRDLEGSLKRVLAYARATHEPVSLERVQQWFGETAPKSNLSPTKEKIIAEICNYFGISQKALMGKGRQRFLVYPRQLAMYLVRKHTSMSYPEIGRFFQRDHTTIMNACQKIEKKLKMDQKLREKFRKIEAKIK